MGAFDNFRKLIRRRASLGIELGREISAVELQGDPPSISAAGHSAHAGYSGRELGGWLRRWLETIDVKAKGARAVVVEGDIYHYLVSMPEMSDRERHLAAGAEVRKLAPVPASQLVYSHMAVGYVEEGGTSRQKVLISAVDKSTLRGALDTIEAAGLRADIVTTVPVALVKAAQLLPPSPGGSAIAYLAAGRSYLVVFQNGVVELVRDFVLRAADRDFEPADMAELIASELRRSFLYFGQRVRGATVQKLVLAGPMSNLTDLAQRLRESLGIDVEPFDVASSVDLGPRVDIFDQPALAVAMGAAAISGRAAANLVAPEEVTEGRTQRFFSTGRVAAAAVLLLLAGWGLLAMLDTGVQRRNLGQVEEKLVRARQELEQARATARERGEHQARRTLLQSRGLESTLIGALLQRIAQRIPDKVVAERISWRRVPAPEGELYWDAQIDGFVLGDTRSESQAIFNRFYALLDRDPIVDDIHFVEPLVIGTESARTPPPLTVAAQGIAPQQRSRQRPARPGEVRIRTSLDDLPPFGPTETSVGFKIAVQLKALGVGGGR